MLELILTPARRGRLALLLLCSVLGAEELTLNQAVDIALHQNLDIANTALDVSKTRERSGAFRTSLFPKFSVYLLGSEQLSPFSITISAGSLEPANSKFGPIPEKDVKFETAMQPTGFFIGRVSQPLSGLYRLNLNLKALELSTKLAEQKSRSKREDVIRNVKQLYYNIQQIQSSSQAARETVQLYKEVERVTNEYVTKETALEANLLQAQTNLAQAEQSELTLSNQEADQKEQLNDLMGRDVLTEFTVTSISSAQAINIDLPAARKQALAHRPEVEQSRLKTLQSEEELKAKRAEYIPEIAAEFNSLSLVNYNSFLPTGSYSAGLSLTWEPFDWGRKKHEIAEKRESVTQDRNSETSTQRKVIMEIDNKYRAVQQNWAKLHAADFAQRAATENLRVTKNEYEVKAALLQVVFQSESSLAQANSEFDRALADYWSARADFEHALGDDQ